MSNLSTTTTSHRMPLRTTSFAKTLLAIVVLVCSVVVSAQPSQAVGEVVVGVGGDPVSAVRTGCTTGAVNALLNVSGVLYAGGRTNSSCTSGSTASPKGWVGRFVNGAWEAVGVQTIFDKEVIDLKVSGSTLYASGAFANGAIYVDSSTVTSATTWNTFTGNPLAPSTSLRGSASSSKFKSMLIDGTDMYLVGEEITYPVIRLDMTSGSASGVGPSGLWTQAPSGYPVSSNAIVKVGSRLYMAYENPPAGVFAGSVVAYSDDSGASWSTTSFTGFGRRLATDGTNLFVATATTLSSFDGTSASTLNTLTYGSQALSYSAGQLCYAAGENTAQFASSPYSSWTNMTSSSIVPYATAFVNGKCYWAGAGTKDQTYTTASSWVVKWDMPPPSLSPTTQTRVARINAAMTSTSTITPSAFSATPTYSISPSLPTGLSMSTSTGVISGTPTVAQTATTYVITGTAGAESATTSVTISVSSITPATQTLSGNANTAITASTAFTPTAFTGAVSYAVTTGTLPTGLSISSSTGVISGTPTATSSATITITATGATSGSATAAVTFAITNAIAVTVTASSHTVTAGAAVPTITGASSVSGVSRTGETCTTTYTTSSAAGTYPTTCSGGSAAGYAITYVAGVITVNAAITNTTTVPATTVPVATTIPAVVPAATPTPELVNNANQRQLEAEPGEATAVINGKVVNVVVVKPEPTSDPAALLASANKIVDDLEKLLPQGAASPVKVVKTAEGASLTGILTSPDDPKLSIPVPVESVTLVKAGTTAMLVSALNQTDVPAVLNAGGTIEVTRGGSLAAIAYGLPSAEKGEIVLMSTPRLLGNFTVDADGGYKGQVPLPKDIAFGSHTVVMATKNAKVSLGIKLVRTRLEFRINKTTTPNLFLRRAGIAKSNISPVKVTGQGRCRANVKQITFAAKPGRCFITVKQAAVGNKKAIFYRFTVKVVIKPTKRKPAETKKS